MGLWFVDRYSNKKRVKITRFSLFAEREGFEPPEVLPSTVFKTAAIDHSAISPKLVVNKVAERTRFELVVGLLLRQFSKLVVSATHPPLQCFSSFALASAKIWRVFETAKFLAIIFFKKSSFADFGVF